MQHLLVTVEQRPHLAALALGSALFAAALAAHFPATSSGFIWDDNLSLYENRLIIAPEGLYKFWFTTQTLDYWPLASTTLWLEWRIWGNNPTPYHATNIVLHALAAVVLWRVLKRLGLSGLGAFLGGLLFAVHPVTVESVAWISERKNVLSMLLYLLSVLAYLRFEDQGRRRWYVLALLTAAAALLAKTSVVALPVVLLMLTWWRRSGITWQAFLRTAPFFLVSLLLGLMTVWFQHRHAIAGVVVRPEGLASRIASVGWVYWFYLYKIVVPINLSMVYPRWDIDGRSVRSFVPLALMLGCFTVLWYWRKGWGRGPLLTLGSFVVVLAPVLGLLDMSYARYSLVADHLQYPGIPGLMALAGGLMAAAWTWARRENNRVLVVVVAALAGAIALSLPVLTWRQARLYSDGVTLWSHTISLDDRCWVAYNNRGGTYGSMLDYDKAISDFSKVIEIKPDHAEAYYNRGNAYGRKGDYTQAIRDGTKAIELKPDYAEAFYNRGNAHRGKGDVDQAFHDYSMAIKLQPAYLDAYNSRALIYDARGDLDRAIQDYGHIIRLRPNYSAAYHNRGNLHRRKGDLPRAIEDYGKVVELTPDSAEAYYERANAYAGLGDFISAISDYTKAIEIKPDFADAYNNRGAAYSGLGNLASAIQDHSKAIELKPDFAAAYNNLGNAYVGMHDESRAIREYSKAIELSSAYADAYFNRGIARKNLGHLRDAIRDFTRTIELMPSEADAFGNRATAYFMLKQYDLAWQDVTKCRQLGGKPGPEFLRDLAKASGRTE